MKKYILTISLIALVLFLQATTIYVSPGGGANNAGTKSDPLSFQAAIQKVSSLLKENGLPKEGINIYLFGGDYYFKEPVVLGEEFRGTAEKPIVIKAIDGENVQFLGSVRVDAKSFKRVRDKDEMKRLAQSAIKNVWAATITDPAAISRFNQSLMLNLSFNGTDYLPSVFPNKGYADFVEETVSAEVTPPAVPVGKEDHGVRAAHVPYLEEGKERGWKGSLDEPRGARAQIDDKADEMAGTWLQWENELKRNNKRNQLTGFIEASWLLSSQAIYAASHKDKCLHLSRVLAYGWAWRKNDKPFRVFGMLCELDAPGEWHFDPLTNRLFIYPPEPITKNTEVSLSVANGFLSLQNTRYVQVVGISVVNVGGGNVYEFTGEHNLLADCKISNSTATGVYVKGKYNSVVACDLVDLDRHVTVEGGLANGSEITPAFNKVENCHIYQDNFKHEKVNILYKGCGNIFRNNLIHNSIGQSMVVNGNEHLIELNEFFNIGFEEGDGGAIYSGADLGGFGNVYRYNFFHHLMHCPGKVTRAGIHLDDGESGATCYGNVFYKSAAKGLFAFGGAGHTFYDNVLLEGDRGIYFCRSLGEKMYRIEKEIRKNPHHHRIGTKEDYVGRVEKRIGKNGWENPIWMERYPEFNRIMSDTAMYGRMWPIRYKIFNNYAYGNANNKIADYRISDQVLAKSIVEGYKQVEPADFVDYDNLDLSFKNFNRFPQIPFGKIGLKIDAYRTRVPDKTKYRRGIKDFYKGIGSMPGTKKQIDTAKLVQDAMK